LRDLLVSATLDAMPARPRDHAPGAHHVWVKATGNWSYFVDELDRQRWVQLLERVAGECDWTVLAFCEMTTHVHAVVDVPDASLPLGMQYLSREYGKHFNLRHDRVGHFVQRRYGNRRIENGRDLLGTYAYVVANPVKDGACQRAEDWRWSSYGTALGLTTDFSFVDPTLVLAELDGSLDALRALVANRAEHLSKADVSW
jgi:REP element-mobilizing transposase RayT